MLLDPDVPDIWLTLIGQDVPTGIEAKVIDNDKISFRQSQISAWKSNDPGNYTPNFWVVTNREVDYFYCWRHTSPVGRLDSTKSEAKDVTLSVPKYPPDFKSTSMAELALYILVQHNV